MAGGLGVALKDMKGQDEHVKFCMIAVSGREGGGEADRMTKRGAAEDDGAACIGGSAGAIKVQEEESWREIGYRFTSPTLQMVGLGQGDLWDDENVSILCGSMV